MILFKVLLVVLLQSPYFLIYKFCSRSRLLADGMHSLLKYQR
jgi:hypothetical protein